MKKGRELNITPIKPTVHFTNKQIDSVLYSINDEFYYFSRLYINERVKNYLLNKIENAGKQLNDITITRESPQLKRRTEILESLRLTYKNLKSYSVPLIKDKEIHSMNDFYVGYYLKQKEEGLTVEQKLDWIKKIKKFANFYSCDNNLKSVQKELLKEFEI